ncbi:probable NPP1 domain protein [Phialocephala subalpina]|uniref:Probable NPP1 domain protein n=1 Tax=Phialocephala subalpina TaxID=576137 RepID=A0A1L7XCA3_9HELO|nr:probable NPP1 domain protein [Phialocephala subalpina]
MAVISRILAAIAASSAAVNALPNPTLEQRSTETGPQIAARSVIAHDAVVGFAETVPDDTLGVAYEAYQPFLKVVNGCVPFPAVDAEGNTSGGLKPTGDSSGGCSSSTGQIYSRGEAYGDYFAIMYSWYMPKDEPSTGIGHRHDWEGVVVWLTSETSTDASNIVAVCPSAHGGWDCDTSFSLSGTGPLIKYESIWPVDHSCGLTTTVGGQQPLIAWESLPAVAQSALETTDFGSAIVPFIDAHFATNLGNCAW